MGVSFSECIQVPAGFAWNFGWLSSCHEAVYHLKVFFKGENFSLCIEVDDLLVLVHVPVMVHTEIFFSFIFFPAFAYHRTSKKIQEVGEFKLSV